MIHSLLAPKKVVLSVSDKAKRRGRRRFDFTEEFHLLCAIVGSDMAYVKDSHGTEILVSTAKISAYESKAPIIEFDPGESVVQLAV
jgi:hypothetical protein